MASRASDRSARTRMSSAALWSEEEDVTAAATAAAAVVSASAASPMHFRQFVMGFGKIQNVEQVGKLMGRVRRIRI